MQESTNPSATTTGDLRESSGFSSGAIHSMAVVNLYDQNFQSVGCENYHATMSYQNSGAFYTARSGTSSSGSFALDAYFNCSKSFDGSVGFSGTELRVRWNDTTSPTGVVRKVANQLRSEANYSSLETTFASLAKNSALYHYDRHKSFYCGTSGSCNTKIGGGIIALSQGTETR